MKTVFIIRHASGAGGSSLARTLYDMSPESIICEADDYFIDWTGEYKFDPNKLGQAHEYCKNRFVLAIEDGAPLIICSNTNTTPKEYQFYLDKAIEAGYIVHMVVVERFMDTKSVHNVPDETIQKQKDRLKNSIRL
jgi:predicted ABC-type ATPase